MACLNPLLGERPELFTGEFEESLLFVLIARLGAPSAWNFHSALSTNRSAQLFAFLSSHVWLYCEIMSRISIRSIVAIWLSAAVRDLSGERQALESMNMQASKLTVQRLA